MQDFKTPFKKKPHKSKLFDITIYIIFTMTMILLSPLIFIIVIRLLNINYNYNEITDINRTSQSEATIVRTRNYSYTEHSLDLSVIKNMNYFLVAANVTDDAESVLFCGEYTGNERRGEVFRIVMFDIYGTVEISKNFFANRFLEKIREKDYSYKDYGDGYIYIASNEDAVLFDLYTMRINTTYRYPPEYEIYQAVLSNDRTMLALSTNKGLFVTDIYITSAYPKELISAIENVSGVKTLPKNPVWSSEDEYIYYTLYADTYIKSAGRTPLSLGGNEQFPSLENINFYVLSNDSIFYYNSASYHTSFENSFRCGYFTVNDRRMTDMIRSHIYYFDIKVSSEGNHLAALSYNGKLKKISIFDIKTKKNIYSALYDDIYEFAFSPNEKNIIIYGLKNGKEDLCIIEIDWTED